MVPENVHTLPTEGIGNSLGGGGGGGGGGVSKAKNFKRTCMKLKVGVKVNLSEILRGLKKG